MTCPFCNLDIKTTWFHPYGLAHHVLESHPELGLKTDHWASGGEYVNCWCGACVAYHSYPNHILENGGWTKHYLEGRLLGPDEPKVSHR